MPECAYVALGSNMGDRNRHLAHGRDRLARLPKTRLLGSSSIEETLPIGPDDQPSYLNQMVLLFTELSPKELLRCCNIIEDEAGRVRDTRWGPRTLDLDIVRFGDAISDDEDLKLPHPEFPNRSFWQREAAELEQFLR